MTLPEPTVIRKMIGRDLLALAIARLQRQAAFSRDIAGAYGPDCDADILREANLWDGIANALQIVAARGAIRLQDRPADKDGKPKFISSVRHEIDGEIAELFAGALRSAFAPLAPAETSHAA